MAPRAVPPPSRGPLKTLTGHSGWPHLILLHPDGRRLLSTASSGDIRVWDLEAGECVKILQGHRLPVSWMAISPDGRDLLSVDLDGVLKHRDLDTGATQGDLWLAEGGSRYGKLGGIGVHPDGRRLVWNERGGRNVWRIQLRDFSFGEGGDLSKWIVDDNAMLVISSDGRRVAYLDHQEEALCIWDLPAGRREEVLQRRVTGLRLLGAQAITETRFGTLAAWDLWAMKQMSTLESTGKTPVVGVVVAAKHPDGQRALVGNREKARGRRQKTLKLWDLSSGASQELEGGHTNSVSALLVHPDGRRAISASADSSLKVWDLETGACIETWSGHTADVSHVVLHPDGRRAISSSRDATLNVWELGS